MASEDKKDVMRSIRKMNCALQICAHLGKVGDPGLGAAKLAALELTQDQGHALSVTLQWTLNYVSVMLIKLKLALHQTVLTGQHGGHGVDALQPVEPHQVEQDPGSV